MKESRQTIYMLGWLEVWRLNVHSKPEGRRTIYVPVDVEGLLNLHVDPVANRVEVEHDWLLLESKTLMRLIHHRVYVFVDRLFDVDLVISNLHDMALDVCKSQEALLKF